MTKTENLCKGVCDEFKSLGFKKDIDPRTLKESYNISKQADGEWFKSTKLGLHEVATRSELDFKKMPLLKKLTDLIDDLDPEVKKEGGRIFITESVVFKIVKGTQHPILLSEEQNKPGKHRTLCDEIAMHGLEKDRYRTEETYMLTKTAGSEWSMSSSHENHSGVKKILDLGRMPLLKIMAAKIGKIDPSFQSNGGRIFITPTRIYRLKNKVEMDFKL